MNNLKDFPRPGPDAINTIVDNIETKGVVAGKDYNEMVWRVCDIVCRLSPTFWSRALFPKRSQTNGHPTSNEEALVVAIGLGDAQLMDAFLRDSVSPWGKTLLFGRTWECIAKNFEVDTIRELMGVIFPAEKGSKKRKAEKRMLGATVAYLLHDGYVDCATLLLHFYLKHFGDPTQPFAISTFPAAWKFGARWFLETILSYAVLKPCFDTLRHCIFGHTEYPRSTADVLRILCDYGVFCQENINEPQPLGSIFGRGQHPDAQSVLDLAVISRDKGLVARLLRHGARPDGVMLRGHVLSYPLKRAIMLGNHEIVKLLLKYGADPAMGWTIAGARGFVFHQSKSESITDAMYEALVWKEEEMWSTPIVTRY